MGIHDEIRKVVFTKRSKENEIPYMEQIIKAVRVPRWLNSTVPFVFKLIIKPYSKYP